MALATAPAALRLVDDYDELIIRPAAAGSGDPIVCREWDPGAPAIRESATERTAQDGTADATAYTGSRTVTFDLAIFGDQVESAYGYAERLAAMTHPSRRPWLYVTRTVHGGDEWRMGLRGNPFSIAYGRRAAALLEMSLAFTAPDGYFESPLRGIEISPPGAAGTGLALPEAFPWVFGAGADAYLGADVSIIGSAPVAPTLYFYGPVADPQATVLSGPTFRMDGLTVDEGQFLAVDMAAGTVRLGADPAASVYHLVDWAVSSFWQLRSGTHRVTYEATAGRMYLQWRDRRLTA